MSSANGRKVISDTSPLPRSSWDTDTLLGTWRWWLPPALIALALAVIFVDPFAGDWDALDYTVLAVQGRPSSMILGRSLFIFANHGLWRIAHALFALPPEKAYLLFKYAIVVQSPVAIIAWWRLARDLTNSMRAATLAALLLALSPYYILYSGQVMTEIPSLLLLAVALTIHLQGLCSRRVALVIAGAALLGLGVNIREGALLYAPWLVAAPFACGWKWRRRDVVVSGLACLTFLVFAFGPFIFLLYFNAANYRMAWHGWIEASRLESVRHPVRIGNMWPLLRFFFFAGPLVLVAFPVAALREWKRGGPSPLLVLATIGVLANLSLIMHYSVIINGRYMLTGMPALTPLIAAFLLGSQTMKLKSPRLAFASVVLGISFTFLIVNFFFWPGGEAYRAQRALAKDYRAQLALVPRDAVMISGSQTVAVTYWRGLGAGEWDVIGSGSSWPSDRLASIIGADLGDGRRVFLDGDSRWWSSGAWQDEEIRDLVGIESRFHFHRISDTVFEIRPQQDQGAFDQPHLRILLRSQRAH